MFILDLSLWRTGMLYFVQYVLDNAAMQAQDKRFIQLSACCEKHKQSKFSWKLPINILRQWQMAADSQTTRSNAFF